MVVGGRFDNFRVNDAISQLYNGFVGRRIRRRRTPFWYGDTAIMVEPFRFVDQLHDISR